ncbi:hypothetical protein N7491_005947 [Penicillium cf. griseofulvum]|uniref:A-kinase anchor protein 7-like phosphoesterase domain-containing protein n=1 Tax=Penicillium cf. griseofulvum TaxID=2972120 RepID=A0A9W9J8H5_9EURO|nr:hypothetical protein N7472_008630 [Penicillium cf. griseofulvum]KAJ5435352.1 hypothetical protein N7491_005947 [Penicillium cf. griseofulvum]KAJ5453184.1 hypothetical protein N7445_001367 [Penicillium cf. griseofulvum]
MTDTASLSRHQPRKPHPQKRQKRQKRPQLTHFLCLPLVNTKSLPQLDTSLAAFKTAHLEPGIGSQSPNGQGDTSRLGLPSRAFRPLGTLHLTLGVMSLTNKERLDQALAFFQSLDLAEIINEVEQVTAQTQQKVALHQSSPLTISLESLHALPQGKSATILHASPVDPTDRLLPFCVKLRDKFIEAGFIKSEPDRRPRGQTPRFVQDSPQASELTTIPSDASLHQPKPRPLLLHATIVNTVYVHGRQDRSKDANGNNSSHRLTFDARNLISQYRNYYPDDNRTIPHRSPAGSSADTKSEPCARSSPIPDKDITSKDRGDSAPSLPPSQGFPFIWAKEIPLDTICICEMGAKKLHPGVHDRDGLNERLGEEYTVIAERSLNPKLTTPPLSTTTPT